jgi:glutaredoxin
VPKRPDEVIAISIYTRPGCHLCDEMKAAINRVSQSRSVPVVIEEIDISSDAELERRYGQEIPVLLIEGRKAAKYRVSEEELTRILSARAGGAG